MLIYLCENSGSDALRLEHHLNTFSREKQLNFDIISFSSGEELSASYKQALQLPDLVLFAVGENDRHGTDTARELRDMGYAGGIIFTSSAELSAEADEVNALYCLPQPCDYSQFVYAMEQCGDIFQNARQNFTFQRKKKQISVPYTDILFFETGQQHTVILHTASEAISFRGTLSQIAEGVCHTDNFLPVGRSFLINLNQVKGRLKNDLVMSDGSIVQVPLRKQEDVLSEVERWQKGIYNGHGA